MPRLPRHLAREALGREQVSPEELAGFHRDRLLDAATAVFAKRGYQQTTIENIVGAARSSVGSFYQRFENKEDCFLGAFDRIVGTGSERIAAAAEGSESWVEEAYLGLSCLLEIFVAEPLAARIVLIEAQTAGAAGIARYNELVDGATTWLREGREHYPTSTQLPPTFEQAAVGGLAFFLGQRLLASEPLSAPSLLADGAQMLLEPIVGAAEFKALPRATSAQPA